MRLIAGANTIISTSRIALTIQAQGVDLSEIDFSAYILSSQSNKVRGDDDMIFYGQTNNQSRSVSLKNLNDYTAEFIIDLAKLPSDIGKVAICATMANALDNFSKIQQLNINLLHNDHIIADAIVSGANRSEAALILGEFYKYKDNWKFRLVTQGFNGGLKPLAEHFGVEIANDDPTNSSSDPSQQSQNHRSQINTQNTSTSLLDTLKSLFSTPIKAVEKMKQEKEAKNQLAIQEREAKILHAAKEQKFNELLVDALSDGILTSQEMKQLNDFCISNSLDMAKLLHNAHQPINNFLQFTLSSITNDGYVDDEEKRLIKNLCDFLKPSANTLNKINQSIEHINKIAKIKRGDVTPISVASLITKNSEIVWLHHHNVKSFHGKGHVSQGEIFVTSERVIYKADKSIEIPLNSILAVELSGSMIYISAKTKRASCELASVESDIIEAYIDQALKRFHRQIDLRQSTNNTRHIPQSVRNAAWQRCGGECVECQSTSYLEFDHIIPFSKGGSNSVANVQLLCRACNLNKSNRI